MGSAKESVAALGGISLDHYEMQIGIFWMRSGVHHDERAPIEVRNTAYGLSFHAELEYPFGPLAEDALVAVRPARKGRVMLDVLKSGGCAGRDVVEIGNFHQEGAQGNWIVRFGDGEYAVVRVESSLVCVGFSASILGAAERAILRQYCTIKTGRSVVAMDRHELRLLFLDLGFEWKVRP